MTAVKYHGGRNYNSTAQVEYTTPTQYPRFFFVRFAVRWLASDAPRPPASTPGSAYAAPPSIHPHYIPENQPINQPKKHPKKQPTYSPFAEDMPSCSVFANGTLVAYSRLSGLTIRRDCIFALPSRLSPSCRISPMRHSWRYSRLSGYTIRRDYIFALPPWPCRRVAFLPMRPSWHDPRHSGLLHYQPINRPFFLIERKIAASSGACHGGPAPFSRLPFGAFVLLLHTMRQTNGASRVTSGNDKRRRLKQDGERTISPTGLQSLFARHTPAELTESRMPERVRDHWRAFFESVLLAWPCKDIATP